VVALRFDSCTVVYEEIQTGVFKNHPSDTDIKTSRSTVSLGLVSDVTLITTRSHPFGEALTGQTLECDPAPAYEVLLSASKGIDVQRYMDISGKSMLMDRDTDLTWLRFIDESVAQRVAKAFQHAADLCRGKEPF
jgi:hypothetical protein